MTRKSVWTNDDGLTVGFGPREASYTDAGVHTRDSATEHVVFEVRGSKFVSGSYVFDSEVVLPEGAIPESAYVEVDEAFVLGGTTPTIQFGTSVDAAAFGSVTEAQGEAAGTYKLTVTDTPLATNPLQVTLGGTTPTVTSAGKMKVVLRYVTI